MSQRYLMGLDLGGGGVRCLLVDPDSGRAVSALRPVRSRRTPGVAMAWEFDPAEVWSRLGDAVAGALAAAAADPHAVVGIAATSMRHGSAVLDREGRELLLAPNRDARGLAAALELSGQRAAELHRRTGHWPNPVQPAARLRWLMNSAPETWSRADVHLSLSDWLAFRLCGERATDPSQASETLLLDIARPAWDAELVESLGLTMGLLPELRPSGSPLGALTAAAASELGLRAGTPVCVGGADSQCGLLGAGVVTPGQLGVVAGTTAPVLQVLDAPTLDDEGRLWTVHHVVPGRWALESNAGGVGEAFDWMARLLYPDVEHPILHMLHEAAASPPGSAGLLSTLGAEVMDARQLTLPIGNLTLSYLNAADDPARRRHLVRSILEGAAFSLRANAEQIEAVTGRRTETPRLSGGLSRSTFFTQLVCDVFDRPVAVTETSEASALGAAICAGVGAGVFGGLEEGAAALVRVTRRHAPDAASGPLYAELYPGWNELRTSRVATDARAAGLLLRGIETLAPEASAADAGFRPRILVSADMDEAGLEALRDIGEVEYASFRRAMRLLTGPSLVEALRGVHVFVSEIDVIDAAALLEAPDLRVVAVCRGDAVNVDVEACTALGIPVLHTPGRNAGAVADLTVAFLLMLARKLPEANAFLREPGGEAGDMGRMGRAFGQLQGRELWRKTVGLVGLGAVGRRVVERLRPFGARCLVHDPYLDPDAVRLAGAEPVSFDELLRASDFISLHAAVTEESRGLIGAGELKRMQPGSFLVNTARAALVDEDALLAALSSGRLGGAALDVFAVEPPASDHPLLALPNVIATPHVGGNTADVAAHQGRIVADDLARLRRGEPPLHALNPETLPDFDWSQPRPAPAPELAARLGNAAGPAVTDLQKASGAPRRRKQPRRRSAPSDAAGRKGSDSVKIRESMERLLRNFLDRIRADEALGRFAKSGQDVTLHFALTDLGTEFHFGFRDAEVFADLGAPQEEGAVQLKMKADLLDGMFTGRRNAMQSAMDGELSFSGDTAKAMTLTQIQRDLSRLYGQAREEVGDPGDLTAIPDAAGAASPATASSSVASGDVRHELIGVVQELYAAQLITATGGNVSVRVPDSADEAWITPSQLFKGDLRPEILVRMGMDGRSLEEGARSPSSEALMHTAVLKAKAEAQAVIHCHAPHATILVNSELPFLPISTEAAFFQNIGRIPFIMPGTQELADAIVEAMGDGWAVLMQNHGLLVAGRSLRRAADMAEIIERTSQVIIGCYAVGKQPPVLPEETVEMLSRYGDLMA